MNEFLKLLPQINDSIKAGNSLEKEYVIYTDNLPEGITNDSIFIASNDPNNPIDTIAYSITKGGYPEIDLAISTLDFGEVLQDHFGEEQVRIENTGCEVLVIDAITSSSPYFFALETSFEIEPFSTEELTLYFYPQVMDEFSEFITIHNNDVPRTINVKGVTADTIPPVVSVAHVNDDNPDILVVEFNEEIRNLESYIGFSVDGTSG